MTATIKSLFPVIKARFKLASELFEEFGIYIVEDSIERKNYLIIHTDECVLKVPFRDGTPCFAYVHSYSNLTEFIEAQEKMNFGFRLTPCVLGIEQKEF
jgi:hypothetical protein